MNAIAPKGWCPSLHAPMASGDGLLVRVRPHLGALRADAARALAEVARRHGNGCIDLTNRASIQARGLSAATLAPFAAAMVAAGLADPDPDTERRRTLIPPPLPDNAFATTAAAQLETLLAATAELSALPAKFGFAVDPGGALGGASADIAVRFDGDACRVVAEGAATALACAPADAPDTALRLARRFIAVGGARRMRALVAAIGADAIYGAPAIAAPAPRPAPVAIGWLPAAGAFGVGLPFGAITADQLAKLADLAERFGDGALRVTPWRAFALAGAADPGALSRQVERLGLLADPADPRARIAACPGAPACASASVPARADAAALAALGLALHVSGCAKGCAHPGPAAVTLVGQSGRYALVRNGRAGDTAAMEHLSLADAMAALHPESRPA